MKFSIFDNETKKRVSPDSYRTAEEANHDYYMNHGHTHVGVITKGEPNETSRLPRDSSRSDCPLHDRCIVHVHLHAVQYPVGRL